MNLSGTMVMSPQHFVAINRLMEIFDSQTPRTALLQGPSQTNKIALSFQLAMALGVREIVVIGKESRRMSWLTSAGVSPQIRCYFVAEDESSSALGLCESTKEILWIVDRVEDMLKRKKHIFLLVNNLLSMVRTHSKAKYFITLQTSHIRNWKCQHVRYLLILLGYFTENMSTHKDKLQQLIHEEVHVKIINDFSQSLLTSHHQQRYTNSKCLLYKTNGCINWRCVIFYHMCAKWKTCVHLGIPKHDEKDMPTFRVKVAGVSASHKTQYDDEYRCKLAHLRHLSRILLHSNVSAITPAIVQEYLDNMENCKLSLLSQEMAERVRSNCATKLKCIILLNTDQNVQSLRKQLLTVSVKSVAIREKTPCDKICEKWTNFAKTNSDQSIFISTYKAFANISSEKIATISTNFCNITLTTSPTLNIEAFETAVHNIFGWDINSQFSIYNSQRSVELFVENIEEIVLLGQFRTRLLDSNERWLEDCSSNGASQIPDVWQLGNTNINMSLMGVFPKVPEDDGEQIFVKDHEWLANVILQFDKQNVWAKHPFFGQLTESTINSILFSDVMKPAPRTNVF